MASAKAEVLAVSFQSKPNQQPPQPGAIPDPSTRYALVQYRFIDSNVQAQVPFDDWRYAPGLGDIIEVSITPSVQPIFGSIPEALQQYGQLREALNERNQG